MTHHESCVTSCDGMSHAGLRLREEPLYKGTLGAWIWARTISSIYPAIEI